MNDESKLRKARMAETSVTSPLPNSPLHVLEHESLIGKLAFIYAFWSVPLYHNALNFWKVISMGSRDNTFYDVL